MLYYILVLFIGIGDVFSQFYVALWGLRNFIGFYVSACNRLYYGVFGLL